MRGKRNVKSAMDLPYRKLKWSFPRRLEGDWERSSFSVSRRRIRPANAMDAFKGFRWIECEMQTAVNPVTKSQVTLTPPVKLGCFEDFAKFNDQWAEFCGLLSGDPDEVCFELT
jgi:hypothetical protein